MHDDEEEEDNEDDYREVYMVPIDREGCTGIIVIRMIPIGQ